MYLKQTGLQKNAIIQHEKLAFKKSGMLKTLVNEPQN